MQKDGPSCVVISAINNVGSSTLIVIVSSKLPLKMSFDNQVTDCVLEDGIPIVIDSPSHNLMVSDWLIWVTCQSIKSSMESSQPLS